MTMTEPPPAKAERWTAQWKELYDEVITTGLCTGCAGCVVTCPHDVIGYEHEEGKYMPFHLEEELGPDNCIHGEKGCTTCTRACPRFRAWETERRHAPVRPDPRARRDGRHLAPAAADPGDRRRPSTHAARTAASSRRCSSGCCSTTTSRRRWSAASSPTTRGRPSRCSPATVDEVLATAGSRYTYCANPLALREAKERGPHPPGPGRHGLPDIVTADDVGPQGRQGRRKPFLFNIGLLCSKTFDDAIFPELFEAKYGLKKSEMVEDEHQGRVPDLDEGRLVPRDRSQGVPPVDARRAARTAPTSPPSTADIATGGIGEDNDWTLTIVRTELGEEVINADDRRRRDRRPPRAGGREGDEAAAPAVDRQPPAMAGMGRPRTLGRRAAAEEEGRRRRHLRRAGALADDDRSHQHGNDDRQRHVGVRCGTSATPPS